MCDALYFVLYDMGEVKQPSLLRVGLCGIMRKRFPYFLLRNFSMLILYFIALLLLFELSVWVCLFWPVPVAEMVKNQRRYL